MRNAPKSEKKVTDGGKRKTNSVKYRLGAPRRRLVG